ncbi:MAG: GntR family transcriptional regulator [Bifidobacteriaceae bacterium]|jgi:DNA-binding FadR family transcriptional regulator|nr:GntR family transcriptional regulator [Bifidobacteriaceae bacterium]
MENVVPSKNDPMRSMDFLAPEQAAGPVLGKLMADLSYQRAKPIDVQNRYDATMNAIKSYILQHQLTPGDPLPTETELCDALQTSRSSIREAIRKLEALHIVSVQHGRGMFVGDLSLDPLVETLSFKAMMPHGNDFAGLRSVVQLRHYLDLGCAQTVVSSLEGTRQPGLEAITEKMAELAKKGKTFLTEDITFHMGLMQTLHNDVAQQLVQSLWLVHMAVIPKLGLQISESLNESAVAHKVLLDKALSGDLEGYRQATDAHYRPIEAILENQLKENVGK